MILPWRTVDGISTSLTSAETAKLCELAAGKLVLEVGSAYGYSAIKMAEAGAVHVVAIDPHAGENARSLEVMRAEVQIRGLQDSIGIWQTTSQWALPALVPFFGLVFIDGDHSEEQVAWDVRCAWPLVSSNGWLAAHDYGEDCCPGVKAALDAWREPDELVDTLWLARKV